VTLLALTSTVFFLNFPQTDVASGPNFAIAQQDTYRPVPIVMVVFDEFPLVSLMDESGAIDSGLYPNLARLSEEATWYRNTLTPAVFTHEALPAILTGKEAGPGETVTDIHPRNLFTLLGDAYKVRTYERLPGFCPKEFCDLAPPPMAEGNMGPRFRSFGSGERGTWFGSFLDLIKRSRPKAAPRFYFNHLVYPHTPWRYLRTGQRYLEDHPAPGEVDIPGPGKAWGEDRWLVTQIWQRHLMQAAHTDRLVGALIDRMQSQGIYDESLLVITADHGVAFEPGHPKRRIDAATAGHVASVPLFIKEPYQRTGRISDAPLQVTDILPTMADILRLSRVWTGLDGLSAVAESDIPPDRERVADGFTMSSEGSEKFDVVQRKFDLFGSEGGTLDLFDVAPPGTRSLLGRFADDIHPFVVGDEIVEIDDASLETTYPTEPMFPSLLEGRVVGDGERKLVAISVNGTVRAVTRTYQEGEETLFYAMLDPKTFGAPPNVVEAFTVERAPD
jgi:hypothetical protein